MIKYHHEQSKVVLVGFAGTPSSHLKNDRNNAMTKLSKRLPGAGTNGVQAFTPFAGRGDSVLTNAPGRGASRRVDVQTGAANPPRRASSKLSLSMSPAMMPIMENDAADWNEPEPGSLVTMTIRNKKSHLYGKTILLERLKNGLYKIVNEDGDTQKDGPKEIIVDLDKAIMENLVEDEIKKARNKSAMETHSESLNNSIRKTRSFKARKSQKKDYIDKLTDLQKNSQLLNEYAQNSLSTMSKGKNPKNKPPKPVAVEIEDVEDNMEPPKQTKPPMPPKQAKIVEGGQIPVSSAAALSSDPEEKARLSGYSNAAYDKAIRNPNINKDSNIFNDIATLAPFVIPAATAAGAWALRNTKYAPIVGLLGPAIADLGSRGMEHKVYGDEIHDTINLPNIADKVTGMVQDTWNRNDNQARDRERRSKLKLDGTPYLPPDQDPDYDRKKDFGYAITDYLGITKDPFEGQRKKTAKSLAIASLRGTPVKKLRKASVLRGPIPGQDSDAEGYAPQTLDPRTPITPDMGHSIRYHAGGGVMKTEPVSDILERFKGRADAEGNLFASQLDAPPPRIGSEDDAFGSARRITYTPSTSEVFRADPPVKARTTYDPNLPARAAAGAKEWLPSPQGPNTDNPDFDPLQSRTITKLSVPQEDFSVIDPDSLNQGPTLQDKGRKRQGDGRRFGSPPRPESKPAGPAGPAGPDDSRMSMRNFAGRLLNIDPAVLAANFEDAGDERINPYDSNDREGKERTYDATEALQAGMRAKFPPSEKAEEVELKKKNPVEEIPEFDL